MLFTIWLLYLVEFADWNSQATIGVGCGNSYSTMGYTNNMPYCTGTTQYGRSSKGNSTQYRNIEGLWENTRDWVNGIYQVFYGAIDPYSRAISGMGVYISTDYSVSTTNSSYQKLDDITNISFGYPSKLSIASPVGFPMFYPIESGGTDSTYTCDQWVGERVAGHILFGGAFDSSTTNKGWGLFFVDFMTDSSYSGGCGCRIMELP